MMRQTLAIVLLLTLAGPALSAVAHAGPVARELKSLGGDVGTPDTRPPAPQDDRRQGLPQEPRMPGAAETQKPEPAAPQAAEPVPRPAPPQTSAEAPDDPPPGPPDRCLAELQTIATAELGEQPKVEDKACAIPDPVILKATLGERSVTFSDGLLLDCPFARQLARFVRDTVQPLARHHIDQPLTHILSGQGFVCRRRNGSLTGKLSEHAFGNATDWVSFRFADKSRLDVRAAELMKREEAEFFNAVRTAACGSFTTVLGPGSNAAHATHLHFDLGRTKSGKKNPYRICE